MRILLLAHNVPYPAHSGSQLRLSNLLRRLAAQHEVWCAMHLKPADDPEAVSMLEDLCEQVIVGHLHRQHPVQHLPGLLSYALRGWPPELKFHHSRSLAREINVLSSRVPFDIIQFEEPLMAPYLQALHASSRHKSALTFYDIVSAHARRLSAISPLLLHRLRHQLNSLMMQRWEPRYAARFDRCITVSDLDRTRLLDLNPALAVDVVPNGVDTVALQPLPPAGKPALLFVGAMNYAPCVDAVVYFCKEVFPRVRRAVPDAVMWIVGSNPTPAVAALEGEHVHVTGRVPDVVPYYARAAVAVVPLRAGGGTRLKILEAMAFGRPVVSTSIGCEGLEVDDNEHLLIADDPESFARATLELLANNALYDWLVTNGRRLVENRYDWDAIAAKQMAIYDALVNEKQVS